MTKYKTCIIHLFDPNNIPKLSKITFNVYQQNHEILSLVFHSNNKLFDPGFLHSPSVAYIKVFLA